MQRVMVIGCCGAGKSTFAKKLDGVLKLGLIHLDQFYWQPGWQETERELWKKSVEKLADKSSWIMDGNYAGTMDLRIERADTILYLDYTTITCLWRITKRMIKYRGQVRPDMPDGCPERFDWNFYHYVATFNTVRRKSILEKLERRRGDKEIIILKDDGEAERLLNELKSRVGK